MVVTYHLTFNLSLCELVGVFLTFLAVGLASSAPLSPSDSAGLFTHTHNPPLLHSHSYSSLLHSHPPLINSWLQLVSQLNLLRIELWLDHNELHQIAAHCQCGDHRAYDKMAFFYCCPWGIPGQIAVRDELGWSDWCVNGDPFMFLVTRLHVILIAASIGHYWWRYVIIGQVI